MVAPPSPTDPVPPARPPGDGATAPGLGATGPTGAAGAVGGVGVAGRRTWFLVDLDAFYVSVEQRRDPSLRGRCVVVGAPPGSRGVVCSASYEARRFGVRSAMPSSRAAALCPGLVFVSPDFAAYERASAEVFEVFRAYAPRVTPVSLDEAFLEVTGCERVHARKGVVRPWLDVAGDLRADVLARTELSVSVGIGGTRTVAKVAANLAKPAGVLEVPAGAEAAFLAGLAVEELPGVGETTRAALARLGLVRVGDLARAPADVLERALGRHGVRPRAPRPRRGGRRRRRRAHDAPRSRARPPSSATSPTPNGWRPSSRPRAARVRGAADVGPAREVRGGEACATPPSAPPRPVVACRSPPTATATSSRRPTRCCGSATTVARPCGSWAWRCTALCPRATARRGSSTTSRPGARGPPRAGSTPRSTRCARATGSARWCVGARSTAAPSPARSRAASLTPRAAGPRGTARPACRGTTRQR